MRSLFFAIILFPFFGIAQNDELHIYNWSEYLPAAIVNEFTKETGIKVKLSTYDSNESMFAKMKLLGKRAEYDLIIPSSYYVSKLVNSDLVQKLDKNKLSNFSNIDSRFFVNDYSVPYLWGFSGIAYNDKYVHDKIDSWNDLFDLKYKHKVLMIDDMREAFDIGLLALGYKANDTDEVHLKEAYYKLSKLVPNIKIWNSESPKVMFIDEEVVIGPCWNGEAYMASMENSHIKFALPKEGALIWVDSFVIPKAAKNPENSYKFINFILRPEVAKKITETIGYSTPNKEALKLINPSLRNNPAIYPPKEYLDKSRLQTDIGDTIVIYGKYWEALRSGIELR